MLSMLGSSTNPPACCVFSCLWPPPDDFGMMGSIPGGVRGGLMELFYGVYERDADRCERLCTHKRGLWLGTRQLQRGWLGWRHCLPSLQPQASLHRG